MSQPAHNEAEITESQREPVQILTFDLEQELYGADISQVKEVLEYCSITRVPKCPSFMAGVLNLRGNVVPVVNLREEFGLSSIEPDVNTCIVIFELNDANQEQMMLGCIVDAVNEVLVIEGDHLSPPPTMGNRIDASFISAMGQSNDSFIMILDMNQVLSEQQRLLMKSQSQTNPESTFTSADTNPSLPMTGTAG